MRLKFEGFGRTTRRTLRVSVKRFVWKQQVETLGPVEAPVRIPEALTDALSMAVL